MLTLYEKTGCPYCHKVDEALTELNITAVTRKDIADDAVAAELVARGGMRQVPYLIDDTHNVEMYESDAIVEYLHKTYPLPANNP